MEIPDCEKWSMRKKKICSTVGVSSMIGTEKKKKQKKKDGLDGS